MIEDYLKITALIAQYTRAVDSADFETLGQLFALGEVTTNREGAELKGSETIARYWQDVNKTYGDAGLATHHMVTNLEFGDLKTAAVDVRSYFLVLQATPGFPLAPIVAGRYVDHFVRRGDDWHYAKKHIEVSLVGDVSHHLNISI
jgi:ketosteroid isomerase-like protein